MPDTLRVKALNIEHTFLLKKKAFLKKKDLEGTQSSENGNSRATISI